MASQQSRVRGLASPAPTLIVAASVAFLFAALFASIAQVYITGLILNIAEKVENLKGVMVTISTTSGASEFKPVEAAALMRNYASSLGIAALLTALSGVTILTVAVNGRKGRIRGLERYLVIWGLLVALMVVTLSRSAPIYNGGGLAVILETIGGFLIAAAGILPSRIARYAAAAALIGGLLVAGGVYMGAYPLKTSTANFQWLSEVDLGVQHNIGAKGLNAIVDPSFALKGKITPKLQGQVVNRLDYLIKMMNEGRASGDIVSTALTDIAAELRSAAESLPEDLSAEALKLAGRAEQMANSNVGFEDLKALKNDVIKLIDEVNNLKPGTQGVATGLEVVALVHPFIIGVASVLGSAAVFLRNNKRTLIIVATVIIASALAAFVTYNVLSGPVKLASDYINMLGMGNLEIRTYTTWKAAATASGLAGISLGVAFLGSLLALLGGILYLAGGDTAKRPTT